MMASANLVICDGCGQMAPPEHVSRRLQRLEWTTRFRPVHIQSVLVGAFPPSRDAEFLYAGNSPFHGEAAFVLDVAGIARDGKPAESVLAEFQRRGLLLTHVLECPLDEPALEAMSLQVLLEKRLPAVFSRVRRSLKPKQLVLVSDALAPFVGQFQAQQLGCSILLDGGMPFSVGESGSGASVEHLKAAIAKAAEAGR